MPTICRNRVFSVRFTLLVAVAIAACTPAPVFARPGGGGGRGPGGGGRPSPGGNVRPGPGGGVPGGNAPGRGIERGPVDGGRVIERGPVDGGRVIEGGVPAAGRPLPGRDVETFINAKPAPGAAAAKTAIDPATAKSRAQALQASLEGRTQPFTPAWYAEHPNAWQYTHPYANWWAVAGVVGLSNWIGYGVYPAGTSTATTTSGEEVSSSTSTEEASSGTTTEDASSGTTAEEAASGATAETTASGTAAAAPPSDLEWLPLGVYATSPQGAAQAHVYQQLAVSKQGELKGNYYDAISNAVQPVSGSIDRATRKATWTVGTAGGATFETTLDALVKTPSSVTMKSGGSAQEWELVQMEQPQGKAATP